MQISFSQLGNMGRAGNQMFQIAATESEAHRKGWDAVFPQWQYAHHFNHSFNQQSDIRIESIWSEPTFNYTPINAPSHTDLRGYFQSEKYFDERHVRHIFTFKEPMQRHDKCVVHLRRGDYVTLRDYFAELPRQYYNNALQELKPTEIIVISDDIPFARKFFDGITQNFFDGDEIESLKLMQSAKQIVMANSSFSWWGAWLSQAEVVAPAQWFVSRGLHNNTADLIPERFKKIAW